jgi:uncharacterized protein (DUF1810 family)
MASPERFKTAQRSPFFGLDTALSELRAGRKTSHWIWYIFPQLAGLGHSSTARLYALRDFAEALDYLRDPELRRNYLLAAEAAAGQLAAGASVERLMGGKIDALKLVSSLTLFEHAAERLDREDAHPDLAKISALCREALARVEAQGFPRCAHTLAHCVHG